MPSVRCDAVPNPPTAVPQTATDGAEERAAAQVKPGRIGRLPDASVSGLARSRLDRFAGSGSGANPRSLQPSTSNRAQAAQGTGDGDTDVTISTTWDQLTNGEISDDTL